MSISLDQFCGQLAAGALDAEISELEETAKEQLAYFSPLKMGTTANQHAIGEYNAKAIEILKTLKAHIQSGANLAE